ncbi:hypothetical protein BC834DRAFT_410216 [Gloeopeniophorella convolvens]|nr:hypothetical protein BC834DRAFT_410216 [Gloeopeniophorella convolvens]
MTDGATNSGMHGALAMRHTVQQDDGTAHSSGRVDVTPQRTSHPRDITSHDSPNSCSEAPAHDARGELESSRSATEAHIDNSSSGTTVAGDVHCKETRVDGLASTLSELYQLDVLGMLDPWAEQPQPYVPPESADPDTELVVLPNGSSATYEQARRFVDFYCILFHSEQPVFMYQESHKPFGERSSWQAAMYVGGTRVGRGMGADKTAAERSCILDVTRQLKDREGVLWELSLKSPGGSAGASVVPTKAGSAARDDDGDGDRASLASRPPSQASLTTPPSPSNFSSWKTVRSVTSQRSSVTRSSIFTMRQHARALAQAQEQERMQASEWEQAWETLDTSGQTLREKLDLARARDVFQSERSGESPLEVRGPDAGPGHGSSRELHKSNPETSPGHGKTLARRAQPHLRLSRLFCFAA